MADLENSELGQEVQRLLQQANKELARFGMVTSSTAKKLKQAVKSNEAALKANTKSVDTNTKKLSTSGASIAKAASEVGTFANSLRKNRDDFRSLNPAIRMTGAALGKAGKAIGDGTSAIGEAISGIGAAGSKLGKITGIAGSAMSLLGKGLSGASQAASELATQFGEFATGELQTVVESFRKIGTVGAIGEKGMTGMYEQAIEAGMSITQFSEAINANGQRLALAYGNTADAAAAMGKLGKDSMGFREEMLKLGYTVADQRKFQMAFMEQNQLLGIADAKDSQALAKASRDYLEELDTLSRVTGKSKDELQKKLDDDMRNTRYQASLAAVQAEGGDEARKQMQMFMTSMEAAVGPDLAKGLKDGIFNNATGASQEAAVAFGGNFQDITQAVAKGQMTAGQAQAEMLKRLNETMGGRVGLAQAGRIAGTNSAMDKGIAAWLKTRNSINQLSTSYEAAGEAQQGAMNATDKNTQSVVDANLAMQDMAISMDKIVKDKVLPVAAQSIKTFTTTLNEAVDAMTEALGLNGPGGTGAKQAQFGSSEVDAAISGAVGGSGGGGGGGGGGGAPITTGTTQQVLDTIKQKESGGNYQAQAKGSSASGAYQFTDSTWQGLTKKHGIGQEFARAKDAPPEIQDMIAKLHAENFMKQAGGDIAGVAKGWYTGNIHGKMSASALAANRGMTADMYAADFQKKFEAQGAKNPTLYASNMPAGRPGSPSANLRDKAYAQEVARLDAQGANAEQKLAAARARSKEARMQAQMVQPGVEVTAANGGTFSGPTSGYAATLHGDEAVVPLPNGRSIPVETKGGGSDDQTLQLMMAQSSKLEQLAKIMSQSASTSEKLLKASV